jgi:hypothetical protein
VLVLRFEAFLALIGRFDRVSIGRGSHGSHQILRLALAQLGKPFKQLLLEPSGRLVGTARRLSE